MMKYAAKLIDPGIVNLTEVTQTERQTPHALKCEC